MDFPGDNGLEARYIQRKVTKMLTLTPCAQFSTADQSTLRVVPVGMVQRIPRLGEHMQTAHRSEPRALVLFGNSANHESFLLSLLDES